MIKADKKYCSYCGSEEGNVRPIGNYLVKLKELDVDGEKVSACQSCYINKVRKTNSGTNMNPEMKNNLINRLKNIF